MDYINQIILGSCLDILQKLPSDIYDSCVTDVPYGLGKTPTVDQIIKYLQGADLVTGDFMGKKWDIPSVLVWREVFRVLKPGAHVLCFGGTRTFDLISMGLRAAGFDNRDTIAENHPGLQWIQGQGMPKSRNLEKAISKLTPEDAEQFSGQGTGLKPTWEPILVFRKPFKGTVAKNALRHGTGGLNIDATRVRHSSKKDFEEHKKQVEAVKSRGGVREGSWKNSSDLSGANDVKEEGRWPPNFVLSHTDRCHLVGTAKIAPHPQGPDRFAKTSGGTFSSEYGNQKTSELPEEAPIWQCAEGCPIAELDRQSGDRPSTLTGRADADHSHDHPGREFNSNSTFLGERTFHSRVYADAGGISRFFPQFEQDLGSPFFYAPKTSKAEKTLDGQVGNEHVTVKPLALMRWLVRLVTSKGGLVLDPYCGSGSTLHAAFEERVRFTGIERDPVSHRTAADRLELVQETLGAKQNAQDNFELWMSLPDDE
jgi:site-specific DNA-methyltransferase (adenine-specific)